MSNIGIVVLVVAVCWFTVALAAGIVLGTVMHRAGTLAHAHEGGPPAGVAKAGVPADIGDLPSIAADSKLAQLPDLTPLQELAQLQELA